MPRVKPVVAIGFAIRSVRLPALPIPTISLRSNAPLNGVTNPNDVLGDGKPSAALEWSYGVLIAERHGTSPGV
jgi:hypothetical protein